MTARSITTCEPPGLRAARSRSVRRVEYVQCQWTRTSDDLLRGWRSSQSRPFTQCRQLNAREDLESEVGVLIQGLWRVEGATNAQVHRALTIDEALLRRAAERRAVGVVRPKVRVIGVEVGHRSVRR